MFQDVATAPVVPTCYKHAPTLDALGIGLGTPKPCPHCAEDEKILQERIDQLASVIAMAPSIPNGNDQRQELIAAALRSLLREVRR